MAIPKTEVGQPRLIIPFTHTIKCGAVPEERVLDILSIVKRVRVARLVRQEEDDEHEESVHDDLLE